MFLYDDIYLDYFLLPLYIHFIYNIQPITTTTHLHNPPFIHSLGSGKGLSNSFNCLKSRAALSCNFIDKLRE